MTDFELILLCMLAGAIIALLPYIVSVIVAAMALFFCLWILLPMMRAYLRP